MILIGKCIDFIVEDGLFIENTLEIFKTHELVTKIEKFIKQIILSGKIRSYYVYLCFN